MKIISKIILSLMFVTSVFSEEATVKPALDVPVEYNGTLSLIMIQKTKSGNAELGKINANFIGVINIASGSSFNELILTPTKASFNLRSIGITIDFNSDQIENNSKSSIVQNVKEIWGTPIKFPLTTDREFLSRPNDEYPILPIDNMGSYIDFVNNVRKFIAEGEHYQTGDMYDLTDQIPTSDENQITASALVNSIDAKEIVIKAVGMIDETDQNSKMKIDAKGEGTMTIKRENALLRTINSQAVFTLSGLEGSENELFQDDGIVEFTLKIDLTSKVKR